MNKIDTLTSQQAKMAKAIYDQLPSGMSGIYDHLIVHSAATPPSLDVDDVWIDRAHRRRGWAGCGYNAVIPRFYPQLQHEPSGNRTRTYGTPGAHVGNCGPGWNKRSVGVVYAGGVAEDGHTPEDNITDDQLDILIAYIAAATGAFDIPLANVMGHRDLIKMTDSAPKACPSFSTRTKLGLTESDNDRMDMPSRQGGRIEKTTKIPKVYTVREGDTLWSISNSYGVPMWRIRELNGMSDGDSVVIKGASLRLLD